MGAETLASTGSTETIQPAEHVEQATKADDRTTLVPVLSVDGQPRALVGVWGWPLSAGTWPIDEERDHWPKGAAAWIKERGGRLMDKIEVEEVPWAPKHGLGESVWLIGPQGPCRATVGKAMVRIYTSIADDDRAEERAVPEPDVDNLDLSYALTGCKTPWAPVAMSGGEPGNDVRWARANVGTFKRVSAKTWPRDWAGPSALAPDLEQLGDGDWETRPDEWWAMQASIPGTPLRELVLEAVWRDDPIADPKRNPCGDESVVFGYLVDELRSYDWAGDTEALPARRLSGAITDGTRPQWLLWGSPVRAATWLGPKAEEPRDRALLTPASHPEDGFDGYTAREYCGP